MLSAQQDKNQGQSHSWETYLTSLNILRTSNVCSLWGTAFSLEHDNVALLREKTLRGTWVAQSFKCPPSAQVIFPGSWD